MHENWHKTGITCFSSFAHLSSPSCTSASRFVFYNNNSTITTTILQATSFCLLYNSLSLHGILIVSVAVSIIKRQSSRGLHIAAGCTASYKTGSKKVYILHPIVQPVVHWLDETFWIFIHTHTRLMALFPGLPGWAGTRKVKRIWILLKQETVSGSDISWAICKSAPCYRQITMPVPHHSVFYRPDALPAAQPTASKHWRHKKLPFTLV